MHSFFPATVLFSKRRVRLSTNWNGKIKKLLKIIVIDYLTIIFNLLFISCLIYNMYMGDEMTKHGGRFDECMGDKKTSHGG
nr:MAG TPA: hypothetical protein [Caudoviricetes sp.]